jgi:hypothetical protein
MNPVAKRLGSMPPTFAAPVRLREDFSAEELGGSEAPPSEEQMAEFARIAEGMVRISPRQTSISPAPIRESRGFCEVRGATLRAHGSGAH